MELQTRIPLSKSDCLIGYDSRLLLLGSCFSEHIGQKFDYFQFRLLSNPFGILFHPKAIANLIDRATCGKEYIADEAFALNGQWHSFDAHSEKSASSRQELIKGLNQGLEQTKAQLQQATHVIVTLGTAWVYRHKVTGQVVANCHKVPQKEFSKELLSISEIVKCLEHMLDLIQRINPTISTIFTVSPVRHLKDGFIENQRGKAHLLAAIHEVSSVSALGTGARYFPSYEIVMDELRDYRFYERDMVHPNQTAVDYIWDRFRETHIETDALPPMNRVEEVQKGLAHRPFNPGSEQHKNFVKSLRQKITYLQKRYPWMEFSGVDV